MCTAITYQSKDFYFGRNLDLVASYNESVVITPRNYPFSFRSTKGLMNHYAIIGMAAVANDYPLYYDATNEYGLCAAGLNFPGNAQYFPVVKNKYNVSSFELIPWILCQCRNIREANDLLEEVNITDIAYSDQYPVTDLHWIFADRDGCLTVEQGQDGLKIYDNPVGVLTNNPPFPYHLRNLVNYENLTPCEPTTQNMNLSNLKPDSLGMGGLGLPGDFSSQSRFARAAYIRNCSNVDRSEDQTVGQFFHILDSVSVVDGCVRMDNKNHKTIYSCCMNADKGIYYYKTYHNNQISAVSLSQTDLKSNQLISYPLIKEQQIIYQN